MLNAVNSNSNTLWQPIGKHGGSSKTGFNSTQGVNAPIVLNEDVLG